jgi:CheY-like chemotaxis protein
MELNASRETPAARAGLRGRVLVVDDERTVAEFMGELLRTWGLDVIVLHDGLQARDRISREPAGVDLVITDQVMPRITGLELARDLLAIRPDLPVLIYTGFSDGIGESDIAAAGIRAMVRKPVDPDGLHRLLQAHLPSGAPRER